jgi:penicillin-binding protein 1A
LVSLNPVDGSLLALVGGFDFQASKFNRATQAERQPGSNIKPFIYSAALDNGFTAATLVSGAPIVVENNLGDTWRPENYSRKVFGPTRLRKALSLSLNLVSVRITRAMGIPLVTDHLEQFGFDRSRLPQGLSLALGSATVTPMENARGYAAFANGGYLVEPYFIARVEDQAGGVLEYANRTMVCPDCTPVAGPAQNSTTSRAVDPRFARRVLAPENAFIMTSLLGEVIRTGTGRAAQKLERHDLAGKTGTTNNFHDAWFTGYNPDVVTSVWVGFDNPRDLGTRESGARAALPVWIDYMAVALADKPEARRVMPENIITAFINGDSGEPTATDDPDGFEEYFVMGTEPQAQSPFGEEAAGSRQGTQQVEGLF